MLGYSYRISAHTYCQHPSAKIATAECELRRLLSRSNFIRFHPQVADEERRQMMRQKFFLAENLEEREVIIRDRPNEFFPACPSNECGNRLGRPRQ